MYIKAKGKTKVHEKKGKGSKLGRQQRARDKEAQILNYDKVPHSFVFSRGDVGRYSRRLVRDLRHVMEPYTATHLVSREKNVLRDYVSVAGVLGVRNFIIVSKTLLGPQLRLARVPRGPTLSFEINAYANSRDVRSSQRNAGERKKRELQPPLLIMNGFKGSKLTKHQEKHLEMVSTIFQNMFPALNITEINLKLVNRCLLLDYSPETDMISFRHYSIRAVPVGTCRSVKKLMKSNIPDLSKYQDISDFLTNPQNLSESEYELNDEHNTVHLPQNINGQGNLKSSQSAIRLREIGPRMELTLTKIQEGLGTGQVLYHKYVDKTDKEIRETMQAREEKAKLKIARQNRQSANIRKKLIAKAEQKQATLAGMKRAARLRGEEVSDTEEEDNDKEDNADDNVDDNASDDDAEYYRKEVGEEPGEDLFSKSSGKATKTNPYDRKGRKEKKQSAKDDAEAEEALKSGKKLKIDFRSEKQKKHDDLKKKMVTKMKLKSKRKALASKANEPRWMRKRRQRDAYYADRAEKMKTIADEKKKGKKFYAPQK